MSRTVDCHRFEPNGDVRFECVTDSEDFEFTAKSTEEALKYVESKKKELKFEEYDLKAVVFSK